MADSESNHNGGLLLFGPGEPPLHRHRRRRRRRATGTARAATRRTSARCSARSCGSTRGGPAARAYSVPRSNPFVGRSGARGEIYSYGLRNPWRFSFDRRTHDLSIGDVGQNAVEEIDFVRSGRGKNFGWRPFEGRSRYTPGESAPGHVRPVIQRFHSKGNCSITGGVVVRDRARARALRALRVRRLLPGPDRVGAAAAGPRERASDRRGCSVPSLSSFGEDARGRVYAVSLDGPVYRIAPR